ncbi:MAG: Ig-like domain-containing protein [Verrucomicrobia bacterium]|nr:Ig-like domain-containing protein [Verrucomicrobiota bacterium]
MNHPIMNQLRQARLGAALILSIVWGMPGASASAAPSNHVVTLVPVAGSNTLNIAISAKGSVRYDLGFPIGTVNIPINSTDSETAQLGGTQTLALEAIFNEGNQGTVTGVNFTDGNIQVLNTLNWHLGLGSYLGFAIGNVYVTGTDLAGRFFTPNPMSAVSGGRTFPLADHELILDGGNLTGYATGRAAGSIDPFAIDLAVSPISGPLAATGTGSVTLSSPTVAGSSVSYTVTATVPMDFPYLLMTDPVDVTVAITGTTQWQGTLTRLLPAATQTALTASANPSPLGNSVTFTATVQSGGVTAASATGNIVFQVDGSDVSTNAIANGAASYTTSSLTLGTHTVTAVYSGDAAYIGSSNSLTQGISPPPSVTETDLSLTGGSFAPQGANNLLLGNAGVSTLTTVSYTGTAANLTDGVLQAPGSPGTSSQIVMIQNGTVTYSLGNGSQGLGYTLTGIRSLTAWANNTRVNPKYTVSYSADGITFNPLATVNYTAPTGAKGTDVTLAVSGATHVKYLQFTFPNSQQNSGVAYSELAAYGTSTPGVPLSLSVQILSPERTSVVLNLNGLVTGQSYTVQSSPSLLPDSWSDEVTFTATQSTAAFTYAMDGNARRFYRLKY